MQLQDNSQRNFQRTLDLKTMSQYEKLEKYFFTFFISLLIFKCYNLRWSKPTIAFLLELLKLEIITGKNEYYYHNFL